MADKSKSPAGVEMSSVRSEVDDSSPAPLKSADDLMSPETTKSNLTPRSVTSLGRLKDRAMDYVTETFDGVVNNEDLFPWLNVFIIAGVIGCVEYIPAAILGYGVSARLTWLDDLYNDYGIGVQLPSAIGTSVGLILVSACVGVLYPATKGSGIPHIIAYLSNGKMPQRGHFSIETVIGKIISVCASINSGIAIGREGPAIHIGAALARVSNKWVDKAKTWVTGKDIPFDGTIKSNVVMMGSAAGFASAFRAPIGGFMYIVEELAIHWNIEEHTTVGSHMFFAVAIASFVTNAIVTATSDSGTINFNSVIIYDASNAEYFSDVYKYNDIPWFVMMALLIGVFGGFYTRAAIAINEFRAKWPHYSKWWVRLIDCAMVATITAVVLCVLPEIYSPCNSTAGFYADDDDHRRRLGGTVSSRNYIQHHCEYGYYSPMASLTLSGEEAVIRHMLSRDDVNFGLTTLVTYAVFYIPLTLIVMGLPVAAGTFVPNLLLGSLLGRMVGEIAGASGDSVSMPGIYALLGAGALLGAWTRTMLAITITIVEISGDVGVVLPLIVCTLIARGVSSHIAHHSYTHAAFYRLLDHNDPHSSFTHPNDWAPIVKEGDGDDALYKRPRRRSTAEAEELRESAVRAIEFESVEAAAKLEEEEEGGKGGNSAETTGGGATAEGAGGERGLELGERTASRARASSSTRRGSAEFTEEEETLLVVD